MNTNDTAQLPTLTDGEKQALSLALKFRIDQLKAVRSQGKVTHEANRQIDHLVSAAIKLALP